MQILKCKSDPVTPLFKTLPKLSSAVRGKEQIIGKDFKTLHDTTLSLQTHLSLYSPLLLFFCVSMISLATLCLWTFAQAALAT